MDISFIVVNHNSEKFLEGCLDSIRRNVSGFSYEIIVVQNDGKHCFMDNESDIFQICLSENCGFGSACNAGAKKAAGRIFFFLNPDAQFLTNNMPLLMEKFADEKIGIAAPQLIMENGTLQEWSFGGKITPWSIVANNIGLKKSYYYTTNDMEKINTDWVSGAAFAISKKTFFDIGCFDENFFMYFEDVDLCLRVRNSGKNIVILPEFKVKHLGGRSYTEDKKQKRDYYFSQDYYIRKHFGKISAKTISFLRRVSLCV